MRKIYVVGSQSGYANWMEGKTTSRMKNADLVVFTGGADINPELYGKKPHFTTWFDRRRDSMEIEEFQLARSLGKKIVGICRGAQLLCVMAGGTLIQHQSHPWVHIMETTTGPVLVTSLHHQRQYPWGNKKPNFKLLGWSVNLSAFNYGESWKDSMTGKKEVEVAVYPDIDALAIQSHPEMAYPAIKRWEGEYIAWCRTALSEHMAADYAPTAATVAA